MGLRSEIQGSVTASRPLDYGIAIQLAEMLDNWALLKAKESNGMVVLASQKRKADQISVVGDKGKQS